MQLGSTWEKLLLNEDQHTGGLFLPVGLLVICCDGEQGSAQSFLHILFHLSAP